MQLIRLRREIDGVAVRDRNIAGNPHRNRFGKPGFENMDECIGPQMFGDADPSFPGTLGGTDIRMFRANTDGCGIVYPGLVTGNQVHSGRADKAGNELGCNGV